MFGCRAGNSRLRMYQAAKSGPGGLFVEIAIQLVHHILTADEKRGSLMELGGLYVQYPLPAVGGASSGHFHDEGKGITFVQQAQLAFGLVDGSGVHEDAALDQVAVHIRHHTADVTLRIRSAIVPVLFLTGVDISFHPILVLEEIAVVDGVDLTGFRAFDIRMAEGELADGWVQRKTIYAPAGSIDHHSGGPVDDVAGGYLFATGLEEIFLCAGLASFTYPAVYGKDRPDGNIDVYVAAAIERIEEADIFGIIAYLIVENDKFVHLFAANTRAADAMSQYTHELIVGEDVQLFYVLSLDVDSAGITQDVHQARLVDLYIDPFGGESHVTEEIAQFACGVGEHA